MNKWWKKQNTTIRAAIIGGFFSILVAILTLLGSALSIMVENITTKKIPPVVSVKYVSFGGERFLFASDLSDPNQEYDIATDSCLEVPYETSSLKTQFKNKNWSGFINTTIISNLPIVIEKLELEITNFQPIDPNINVMVHLRVLGGMGMGGPGGFAQVTSTEPVTVSRDETIFDLLQSQAYELPANGVVVFSTPVTLLKPGIYTFRVKPFISNYSTALQPNITEDTAMIKWLFVPNIAPDKVDNPNPNTISIQVCK